MLRSLISLPPDDPVLTPILADMVVRAASRHIDLYVTAIRVFRCLRAAPTRSRPLWSYSWGKSRVAARAR